MDLGRFNIIWLEKCTYPGGARIGEHRHSFFHFLYVDEGVGDITIGSEHYTMRQGNIYPVPPQTNHGFFNKNKNPLKVIEIKFSLAEPEATAQISKLPFCMEAKDYHTRSLLLSMYRELHAKRPWFEEIISFRFQLMLTYLLRCHQMSQNQPDLENYSDHYPPEIKRVLNYIDENLEKDISLEVLANIACFEKNYFLRKFKKATNRTPKAFLSEARIKKAKELLHCSDMNISQIADATGFKTVHYFSNVFLKFTGKRPIEYREK